MHYVLDVKARLATAAGVKAPAFGIAARWSERPFVKRMDVGSIPTDPATRAERQLVTVTITGLR